MPPIAVGIDPEREFDDNDKLVNIYKLPMELGILPVSELKDRSKSINPIMELNGI